MLSALQVMQYSRLAKLLSKACNAEKHHAQLLLEYTYDEFADRIDNALLASMRTRGRLP